MPKTKEEVAKLLELPEGFVPFFGFPDADGFFDVRYAVGDEETAQHYDDVEWSEVIAYKEVPDPEESEDDC